MRKQTPIRDRHEIEDLMNRATSVQQNTLPLDQLRNGVSLDDALWNGFEKPTGIQKAGLIVFSCFFILIGILGFVVAREIQNAEPILNVIGLVMTLIGLKIGFNAFRKRRKLK